VGASKNKPGFRLKISDWEEIHRLPDSWPPERLRKVLESADLDEPVADEDAFDMAALALQDLDEQEAGELTLKVVFGDTMGSGVRQNLVDDLRDDRPWEQFASIEQQAGIFEAMVLLHHAFPNRYGIPDAIRLRLSVQPLDKQAAAWLQDDPSDRLILRLLASGMPDEAVLNRLYAPELASDAFPAASGILWRLDIVDSTDEDLPAASCFDVYSSCQWLAPLEHRTAWEGVGWPDNVLG
jgi:hypothetical protein